MSEFKVQVQTWKSRSQTYELQKLSEVCVKHATHIYYALVCRTALGAAASTKDGKTCARPPKSSRGLRPEARP